MMSCTKNLRSALYGAAKWLKIDFKGVSWMNNWKTIESAPKTGGVIKVGWKFPEDNEMQEWFTMRWEGDATNGMFPDVKGFWVTPCGNLTWNVDDPDGAPTHWCEYHEGNN